MGVLVDVGVCVDVAVGVRVALDTSTWAIAIEGSEKSISRIGNLPDPISIEAMIKRAINNHGNTIGLDRVNAC